LSARADAAVLLRRAVLRFAPDERDEPRFAPEALDLRRLDPPDLVAM
jgi:hypothetical protein